MATKNRAVGQRFENATSFIDHLKLALEFHAEPEVLAVHSPLATPYFLNSAYNVERVGTAYHWGRVLCDEIYQTVSLLWEGPLPQERSEIEHAVACELKSARGSRYDFWVLELNYFQRIVRPTPRNQAEIYSDILHISRATHDRHLREAVERLGQLFLQRLRPTVRLESPALRTALIGREDVRRTALRALEDGQSVALVGVGGVGKTTLGAWLAARWNPTSVFWFTIRPHFNDRLASLLFALGYFLHRRGASGLWLQLVADSGKVEDANLALGLALADIEALPHPPLICVDEVDLLRADDPERQNPQHVQMLDFVTGIHHHAPLLLIGQRALLESDLTLPLGKLSAAEISEWLQVHNIAYSAHDLEELARYTSGNPRLLTLCLALHQSLGQSELAETLVRLPHTPALAPIWERVRKRLQPAQRQLLNALSVFRDAAPRDAWPFHPPADEPIERGAEDGVASLIEHHLVQEDGAGGIYLLPTLRTLLYEDLSAEARETLHVYAARICVTRGEITEAAYHLWQGNRAAEAIKLWYPQRQSQIERGFAGAALDIFAQISGNQLKPAQQRQLALLRAELYEFVGEPDKMVDDLASVEWPDDVLESIDAMYRWGVGLHAQGNTEEAQAKLNRSIDIISYLFNKYAQVHVRRGTIYMQERAMKEAWREANLAYYHSEHLQGAIQDQLGNYDIAHTHHRTALQLAEELNDIHAIARTQYHLGMLATRQHDFETAFTYFNHAIENYVAVGNQMQEMYVRSNMVACYILAEDYQTSIAQAKQALAFYERTNSPYWISLNAGNIAEAYFELGELENAEQYARQAIQHEDVEGMPYVFTTLARIRQTQGKAHEAKSLLTQAIEIAEENEDRWQAAYSRRTLGEVYGSLGEVDDARRELGAALALFQKMELDAEVEKTKQLFDNLSQSVT